MIMKKAITVLLSILILLSCVGCGRVTVHCDACGAQIKSSDKNITEDWILLCKSCAEKLNEEDFVPSK